MKGKNVCYNWGQGEHISPNCPKPKKDGFFSCGKKVIMLAIVLKGRHGNEVEERKIKYER